MPVGGEDDTLVNERVTVSGSALPDSPDLALRALAKAAEFGLIDITWLDGCPLFSPLAPDLRWRVIRDEVSERAARVLAAFRSAAGR